MAEIRSQICEILSCLLKLYERNGNEEERLGILIMVCCNMFAPFLSNQLLLGEEANEHTLLKFFAALDRLSDWLKALPARDYTPDDYSGEMERFEATIAELGPILFEQITDGEPYPEAEESGGALGVSAPVDDEAPSGCCGFGKKKAIPLIAKQRPRKPDYSQLVRYLLLRSDFPKRDSQQNTLVHKAAATGNVHALALVLQCEQPASPVNANKDTPLHLAVAGGHVACVEVLLRARANVNAINAVQETPLAKAQIHGHDVLIQMLQKAGAK
eukprot:TRINITY_DN1740_c0_g2_i1.p1 TRINITY_DN1740_c0_g2~~TRINITY_DN1740_c0_g2_i1.p1  ORF type:complete len:272 (-),score=54.58 TRINITY_DN1740_c0_g2_i1:2012-2827(-)